MINIGGIEFPDGITYNSADCYTLASAGTPMVGWEFHSPTIAPRTIIIEKESLSDAAKDAFEWLESRGHLKLMENWKPPETPKEWRMVGYIMPKSSWGIQDDENEQPRIASKEEIDHPQYGVIIVRTGPPREEPTGRMVYNTDNFYLPVGQNLSRLELFRADLNAAMDLPVLHREDFTWISDLD